MTLDQWFMCEWDPESPCGFPVGIFFFQAEDGLRDRNVTGVQTCALPISSPTAASGERTDPGGANAAGIWVSLRSAAGSVAPASMSRVATVTPTPGPASARWPEARDASARTKRNEASPQAAATVRKILEDNGSLRRSENLGTMRIR